MSAAAIPTYSVVRRWATAGWETARLPAGAWQEIITRSRGPEIPLARCAHGNTAHGRSRRRRPVSGEPGGWTLRTSKSATRGDEHAPVRGRKATLGVRRPARSRLRASKVLEDVIGPFRQGAE